MKQNAATGLIILICIAIGSCKKDMASSSKISIAGSWELYSSSNGWTGKTTFYPRSNGQVIKFTADNTYQIDSVNNTIHNGTYQIVKDSFVLRGGAVGDRIIYDNRYDNIKTFITLSGDTLSFSADAYDVGGSSYLRQQ